VRSHRLLRGLIAGWIALSAAQAELRLDEYWLAPGGEFIVEVTASPTHYYVLFRGDTAQRVGEPVAVEWGQTGKLSLLDLGGGGAAARFYRVLEVPVTVPLDLDGDGIDDLYELGWRPWLDPLDPADAGLDPDGDGWTTLEEYLAGETGVVYLPLVIAGTLQAVSSLEETQITFPPQVLAANPELAGVEVRVPPNALFSDSGARGGRVGIAPVPPDRIPSPLPPGLDFPLVITIQTDGPQNFDRPVPVRFPNLPDPNTGLTLGPGEKTALWSFNHDTGRWEIMGPMTVTADGRFTETDPGVGVLQPGWHGVQPGVGASGGPLGGPCGGGGGGPGRNCRQDPDFKPDDPANYNGCGPDG